MSSRVEDMPRSGISDTHERVVRSHGAIIAVIGTCGQTIELATGDLVGITAAHTARYRTDSGRPGVKGLSFRGVNFHVERLAVGDQRKDLSSGQEKQSSLEGCKIVGTLGLISLGKGGSVIDEPRPGSLENSRAGENEHVTIRQQTSRGIGHVITIGKVSRRSPGPR